MKNKIKAYVVIARKAKDLDYNWYGLEMFLNKRDAIREKEESQRIVLVEIHIPKT